MYNIQGAVLPFGAPSEELSFSSNRLTLENKSTTFFRNVGNYIISSGTESQSQRIESSQTVVLRNITQV